MTLTSRWRSVRSWSPSARVRKIVLVLALLIATDYVASGFAPQYVPRFNLLPAPPAFGWLSDDAKGCGVKYERDLIVWERGLFCAN